jgi:hypothetical protein
MAVGEPQPTDLNRNWPIVNVAVPITGRLFGNNLDKAMQRQIFLISPDSRVSFPVRWVLPSSMRSRGGQ